MKTDKAVNSFLRSILKICVLFQIYQQCVAVGKPNVIIFLADDLGWNDVGFHGSNQIPTPNIDALAYSGIILNDYYTMPICTPSRAALMTSRHPIRTGMQSFGIGTTEPWGLSLEEKILPQFLKEQGYATHALGKWHLGFFKQDYTPTFRGFDSHYGHWSSQLDYFNHTELESGYWGFDIHRGLQPVTDVFGEYTTTLLTREAEQVISTHNTSEPMFLYVAHASPHIGHSEDPLQAPQETIDLYDYIEDYDRRVYAAMVHELDQSVGSVVKALAERAMLDNSIILLSTDNGGAAGGYTGSAGSNWPLRGSKETVWEGGVRGSAILWSPLLKAKPYVSSQLAHVQDWLPTIMSAINASDALAGLDLDGVDLWQAFNEPQTPNVRDNLLINIEENNGYYALRMGDWKLLSGSVKNGQFDEVFPPTGREGQYNLSLIFDSDVAHALQSIQQSLPSEEIVLQLRNASTINCLYQNVTSACDAYGGEVCLFNLADDACEVHSLADEYPGIVRTMQQLLADYNATAVPPRHQPSDPASNPVYWDNFWTTWQDYPPPF